MIVWLILCIITCKLTVSIYKQRKFYQSAGMEISGTVLFWNRKKVDNDWMYPVHYELEVEANGQQYFIETSNPKAKKYKKKTDISLIMVNPSGSMSDTDFPETWHQADIAKKSLYGAFQDEINQMNQAIKEQKVIIKEDVKPLSELIAGILLTFIFGFSAVISLIDIFK